MEISADMLFKQAYALHYKSNNPIEALLIYEQIITEYPNSPEAGYANTQTKILSKEIPQLEEKMEIERSLLEKRNSIVDTRKKLKASGKWSIKNVLEEYRGKSIGINAINPTKVEAAILEEVQDDFFIVSAEGILVNIPYTQIIKIFTSPSEQISVGVFGLSGNFPLIVRVFDFVIYKGAIGISIPI